jgi:hypothetical protein
VGKTLLLSVLGGSLNLVVVVVQTSNVCAGELDDFSGRATNAASDIQNLHVVLEVHDVREVVLVAGKSLSEGLAECETAEVERLAPAVLVKVGGQVVVVAGQGCVLGSSRLFEGSVQGQLGAESRDYVFMRTHLSDLGSLVLCVLVVPVLEVLVDGSFLAVRTLAQHGSETTSLLG